MRAAIPCLPWLLILAACSSPPKPPTVDESRKRPVNSQMAVELQVCRNDLQNTRILATESGRLADTTAATLAHMAARQQVLAAMAEPAAPSARANSIHTVHFGFGSTRVVVPQDMAAALIADAKAAPLVLLRGRTDGSSDAAAESRIARDRAAAVRDYLVAAGVDAARIRATYQPAGDHAADNTAAAGRALNRRVEIEVYRATPVSVGTTASMAGAPNPVQP
ncbi:MAG TPA: OmpA family protein [Methylibium sp.]|jgi:outer membrane protein OmpA-like peptidoglycan-associated protein|nr:OmpA family protein [Methylibium sp.]